jgi:hypothetical protein
MFSNLAGFSLREPSAHSSLNHKHVHQCKDVVCVALKAPPDGLDFDGSLEPLGQSKQTLIPPEIKVTAYGKSTDK